MRDKTMKHMSIEDRIQRLKGEKPKLDDLKKTKGSSKGTWGGKRPNTGGSKPKEANLIARGIKAYMDAHFNEKVKIQITDPKTGKVRIVDAPRIVVVLQKLYEIGMKNDNADALNKWLDRALGKPVQAIEGNPDKPIQLHIDF